MEHRLSVLQPSLRLDHNVWYVAVCSCGRYESGRQWSYQRAVKHGTQHVLAKTSEEKKMELGDSNHERHYDLTAELEVRRDLELDWMTRAVLEAMHDEDAIGDPDDLDRIATAVVSALLDVGTRQFGSARDRDGWLIVGERVYCVVRYEHVRERDGVSMYNVYVDPKEETK